MSRPITLKAVVVALEAAGFRKARIKRDRIYKYGSTSASEICIAAGFLAELQPWTRVVTVAFVQASQYSGSLADVEAARRAIPVLQPFGLQFDKGRMALLAVGMPRPFTPSAHWKGEGYGEAWMTARRRDYAAILAQWIPEPEGWPADNAGVRAAHAERGRLALANAAATLSNMLGTPVTLEPR
jgi:hypothetical protein